MLAHYASNPRAYWLWPAKTTVYLKQPSAVYFSGNATYPQIPGETMPQINQSGKIGKSSSPSIQRVVNNNKNVQQPVKVPGTVNTQFNKKPVKC